MEDDSQRADDSAADPNRDAIPNTTGGMPSPAIRAGDGEADSRDGQPRAEAAETGEDGDAADNAGDAGEGGDGGVGDKAEPEEDADAEMESGGEDAAETSDLPITSVVEALLFAAREPLKPAQIARAVGKGTRQDAVRAAVEELNLQYLETSRSFEIAEISGKFQLMSRPEYALHIMRIYPKREAADREKAARLTPAALDTLAIIAYKQPVTRGEIEHIRGVGCGPVLRALIERGSVKVAGKRTDIVGQPLVYGTTEAFLAEFGLGSLDELPMRNEFLGAFFDSDSPGEEKSPSEPERDAAGPPE